MFQAVSLREALDIRTRRTPIFLGAAFFAAAVFCAATQPALASPIVKANNTTAFDTGGSWSGGIAPGASDVAVFDSSLSLNPNNAALLTADMSVGGIQVTTLTPAQVAAQNFFNITNTASANTLTIGASGIDMSLASGSPVANTGAPLQIQSKVLLSADQTWNISDVSGNITTPAPAAIPGSQTTGNRYNAMGGSEDEDLYFNAQASIPVNLGGFTVNKTGGGTVNFNGGHTLSNGTINLNQGTIRFGGGGNRAGLIDTNVTLAVASGAILRLQSNNAANTTMAGTLNLASGSVVQFTSSNVTNNHVTVSGPVSVTGSVTMGNINQPISGSASATFNLPNEISGNMSGNAAANLSLVNSNTSGNSMVVLSGDNSAFLGAVNFNSVAGARNFRMASSTAGSSSATWTLNSGNNLQIGNPGVSPPAVAPTLGTLNGGGSIYSASTAANSLTVGSGTFSGNFPVGIGSLALTKTGNGTLTLSGSAGFTGGTTVSQGALIVNGSAAVAGATLNGNTTNNSNSITSISSTATLFPGEPISGTNIPANSYVLAITSATAILISQNATGTLAGTSLTYTGIPASGLGTGPVTVQPNGTLGGSGTIAGAVTFSGGGKLTPGTSPGTLTVASVILDPLTDLTYDLDTPNLVASGNDLVVVNTNLTLDGTLNINPLGGFGAGTYRLFNYGGGLTDNGLAVSGTAPAGYTYQVDTATTGQVNLIVTAVPEPASLALAAMGIIGLAMAGCRANRKLA